jgi:polyketide-type polyunsaturated fatty acid synthase PfaA
MSDGRDARTSADIAIIGMACLFPGARDLRRYWQNICRRVDAVRTVPPQRWRVEDFYATDRLAADRIYSRWGAFLDDFVFDPVKWHIPPASLRHIEPMQLLSLEVAWLAMVDAGYFTASPECEQAERTPGWRERAGVLFAVPGSHELGTAYCFRTMMRHYLPRVEGLSPQMREHLYASLEAQLPPWTEDSFPGFLGNVIAGRIAREFDFHGPNFTVDAACAASLAALFTAVELLRSGTSDLMLVGGTDGTNNPFGFMSFARTHALSPHGKSRAFDANGDGIALGEGVAVVVLKRMVDAERAGDKIYAVIKGVGSSSDGKNRSLTAPHPPGQMRAVERAYEDAGLSPASVTLIEAHGTGTAVGDSAELTTLTQVFAPHSPERHAIAVGSVKSMIGHTKTVAGLASLIKTTLALQHRVLPPTINVDKPNPRVDWGNSPFYLNTETRPWLAENDAHPRRAGVSAFGFGGTNFHVVLEEYQGSANAGKTQNWMPRAAEVFVFQRATREEMLRDLRPFQEQLAGVATDDLAGLAASVYADESRLHSSSQAFRLALVATSLEDLHKKLQKILTLLPNQPALNDPSGIYASDAPPVQDSQVCFLYPGQGSQAVNMLRDLVSGCPWGHDLFREANGVLHDELPHPLTRFLYPPPSFEDSERERLAAALADTRVAQPALGAVELFATDLLERFGIRPAFVAGHSYGEIVALHVAGCLSRTDLLRLSAQRGRVCGNVAATCPGAMASVQADTTTTANALQELNLPLYLANHNGPEQSVVAGPTTAIDAAIEQLTRRGLRTRKLAVSAAFHTPLLATASQAMKAYLADLDIRSPRLPVYSNTTGQRHAREPECLRELLARHLSEPVQFEQDISQLFADGARVFLEVGPGKVLTDLVARILARESATALALEVPGREGWMQLAHLLARLTVLGLPVRLAAWFEGRGLAATSVKGFLDRTKAANTPKRSDWLLSPNKAEPISPLPKTKQKATAQNSGTRVEKAAMTTTNGDLNKDAILPVGAINNQQLFIQFQETTRLLLEAQQAQTRVLERCLAIQERLLLQCSQNGATQSAAAVVPPMPAPATTARTPALAPVRPPVPIPRPAAAAPCSPVGVVAQSQVSSREHSNGSSALSLDKPSHDFAASSPAHRIHTNGEGPPPTESFRRDLLEAVSARTGYPIDALDEDLALEAELGIDSIKTVEIFSNLRAYHPYFRIDEQEEEELLAEFTRLKTLRDIMEAYDRRRQTLLGAAHHNGTTTVQANPQTEIEPTPGTIQRYTVTTVPAPLELRDEKKNGRRDGFLRSVTLATSPPPWLLP